MNWRLTLPLDNSAIFPLENLLDEIFISVRDVAR